VSTIAAPALTTERDLGTATEILMPRPLYATIVGHVVRKMTGHYLPGETEERKAFGMIAGRPRGTALEVTAVYPLLVNLRREDRHAADMDEIVDAHAIPSDTPNEQRGWIADGTELLAVDRSCDDHDWLMFGNYHTHRVPWPHDPDRDSCTALDRVLASGTGQWVFIVSAVDLHRPILRAFYEADNEREATIRLLPEPRRASL
jgi:hypothetical protein